ncbi:MAG: GPR endopeptidase [Ruminococcus sp.]|nr:GPR endopeptidase [Ruminococcus sp.]
MQIRTDLALERMGSNQTGGLPGIHSTIRGDAFRITDIRIDDDKSGERIGKPAGRYLTLETAALSRFSDRYQDMAEEFAAELSAFLPEEGTVLVVGLGNRAITPDALGPRTAGKVLATRHLKSELMEGEADFLTSLRPVSVLTSGVLGQTGMETAEIVSAVCRKIEPSAVVAVDALACADLERLGTTIQMCDSGICPGSGVNNRRKELSRRTLGAPVIAVGVPTVVDLHTVVEGFTGQSVPAGRPNLMVTPRDIDRLIDHAAGMISCGINLALHPELTFADAESL